MNQPNPDPLMKKGWLMETLKQVQDEIATWPDSFKKQLNIQPNSPNSSVLAAKPEVPDGTSPRAGEVWELLPGSGVCYEIAHDPCESEGTRGLVVDTYYLDHNCERKGSVWFPFHMFSGAKKLESPEPFTVWKKEGHEYFTEITDTGDRCQCFVDVAWIGKEGKLFNFLRYPITEFHRLFKPAEVVTSSYESPKVGSVWRDVQGIPVTVTHQVEVGQVWEDTTGKHWKVTLILSNRSFGVHPLDQYGQRASIAPYCHDITEFGPGRYFVKPVESTTSQLKVASRPVLVGDIYLNKHGRYGKIEAVAMGSPKTISVAWCDQYGSVKGHQVYSPQSFLTMEPQLMENFAFLPKPDGTSPRAGEVWCLPASPYTCYEIAKDPYEKGDQGYFVDVYPQKGDINSDELCSFKLGEFECVKIDPPKSGEVWKQKKGEKRCEIKDMRGRARSAYCVDGVWLDRPDRGIFTYPIAAFIQAMEKVEAVTISQKTEKAIQQPKHGEVWEDSDGHYWIVASCPSDWTFGMRQLDGNGRAKGATWSYDIKQFQVFKKVANPEGLFKSKAIALPEVGEVWTSTSGHYAKIATTVYDHERDGSVFDAETIAANGQTVLWTYKLSEFLKDWKKTTDTTILGLQPLKIPQVGEIWYGTDGTPWKVSKNQSYGSFGLVSVEGAESVGPYMYNISQFQTGGHFTKDAPKPAEYSPQFREIWREKNEGRYFEVTVPPTRRADKPAEYVLRGIWLDKNMEQQNAESLDLRAFLSKMDRINDPAPLFERSIEQIAKASVVESSDGIHLMLLAKLPTQGEIWECFAENKLVKITQNPYLRKVTSWWVQVCEIDRDNNTVSDGSVTIEVTHFLKHYRQVLNTEEKEKPQCLA